MTTTKTTTTTTARTITPAASASVYQQLRTHLTTLRLHDAAEALPGVLDAATSEGCR